MILQQIYYRYHHKQTTNPAFRFWLAVVVLERRCRRRISAARRMSPACADAPVG